MRKIIVFNLISLDGFFADADGNIDWHNVDDEFNQFAVEHTKKFGVILFGRVTYKIFEDYWPSAAKDSKMSKADLEIARVINKIPKIVFSKTLKRVVETSTWRNVTLLNKIDSKEIKKLKQQPGKDIVIFGSGMIAQQMLSLGLVDEIRLLVNPIILGTGKPMFKDVMKIKLIDCRVFKNGNVLLSYEPSKTKV